MDGSLAGHAKRPAISLDRDGTLNVDCPYCRSPDQITLYDDVFGPLKELSEDYLIIVVSNQSGVARGYYTEDDVKAMNEKVRREVEKRGGRIDAFYYCPHLPEEGCPCRKPKTGMIEKAVRDFNVDLGRSWVVGDSQVDADLAKNAGLRSVIVRNGAVKEDYNADDFYGVLRIIRGHARATPPLRLPQ